MRRLRRLTSLRLTAPVAAVLGAGGALAAASIPSSDHTLTACYYSKVDGTKPYGTLRLIDPSVPAGGNPEQRGCGTDESTVTWNQTGPQGPTGAPGARGPAGQSIVSAGGLRLGGSSEGDLKLDGVRGSLPFETVSLGTAAASTAKGKVKFNPFTITRKIDRSSPTFYKAAVTGKHFKSVTLELRKSSGGGTSGKIFVVFRFKLVAVKTIAYGTTAGGHVGTERITLSYASASEEVVGPNGRALGSIAIKPGATLAGP